MRTLELMEELSDAPLSLDEEENTLIPSVIPADIGQKFSSYRDFEIIELSGGRRCMLDASRCVYELPSE